MATPRADGQPLRIVLDTNVVLDLVVFRDPGAAHLRAAIEARRVSLLTSGECLAELKRVLAYPEFKRNPAEQGAAYDWYATRAELVAPASIEPLLPRCRDEDDQKFLDLAWFAGAEHLVTKDKVLLELARRVANLGRFTLLLPAELAERLTS